MRHTLLIPIALALGCGTQPYPQGLTYPARADRVVARVPSEPADGPPQAGKLEEFIAKLDSRGGKTFNPGDLSPQQQAKLQATLQELFGTPAEPKVQCDDPLVDRLLEPDKLATGSTLYRRHCLQCHGLTGDGRGPTGQWVYPIPRDLRQGIFKYVSSQGSAARKPSREDLRRLLNVGIDRTSMPAFNLLKDEERERLIDYTLHLSLRGEVEYRLLLAMLLGDQDLDDDLSIEAQAILKNIIQQWTNADREGIIVSNIPTPDDFNDRMTPAHLDSVRRGYKLFTSEAHGCISCHVDYGRQARYLYDAWGTSVRVTDLTEGVFRGGKRPIDLFHRIRGGVGPSGMPAAVGLSDAQVWDLVHFMMALPVAKQLPTDVRGAVYPGR